MSAKRNAKKNRKENKKSNQMECLNNIEQKVPSNTLIPPPTTTTLNLHQHYNVDNIFSIHSDKCLRNILDELQNKLKFIENESFLNRVFNQYETSNKHN